MPERTGNDSLEERIGSILSAQTPPDGWKDSLAELFQRYRDQQRLLDRLTHIADRFQAAERDRSQAYLTRYERKVRQLEKIVRISDQYQTMLHQLKERLEHASNYDALTGLPNRRYMTVRLEEAAAQAARRPEQTFAVMVADIDNFKAVNDDFGHAAGDRVLHAVARALELTLREYDLCARWGGEEFLLLFPSCARENVPAVAERLRRNVHEAPLVDDTPAPTISIGYTLHRPGENIDATLLRADEALYKAKAAGRNCCMGL
ncbi:MAG TPA: GGDEF domain-containing protein [Desulfomicrobium sp.]|nr:GGDEF domain-containing protein [Desulfomicrobium sp.]